MSKLTRDQVDFIEEYLIKNKVRYWDIRIELLDHIASAIEQKMQKGQKFAKALKEVHVSFGNHYRSKRLNPERTKWIFTESLYADQTGYKKLVKQKQKELNKRFRIVFGKTLVKLLKSPLFLVAYLFFGVLSFKVISMASSTSVILKYVVLPMLVLATLPVAWSMILASAKRRDSLYLNQLIALPTTTIGVLNMVIFWPKTTSMDSHNIWLFMAVYAMFFPIVVAQFVLFKQESDRYKAYYQKWKRAS